MSKHLLIRADADSKIGTGHVMRCLALAQAWQDDGGRVSLAARELPEGLKQRLHTERVEVIPVCAATEREDAAKLVSIVKDRADIVVVDGYNFGIEHQRALRDAGIRHLFIDDYGHAPEYIADFVLNQNITAEESLYRNRAPHTKLLLGTKYALLRREFRELRNWQREISPKATKIMVTMGGADPDNATLHALRALELLRDPILKVRVAVGSGNQNRRELEAFRFSSIDGPEVLIAPDMTDLMQWADIAVTATGSTSLELLFMQLPFVGLAISENQRALAQRYRQDGIAEAVDWSPSTSAAEIKLLIEGLLSSQAHRLEYANRSRDFVDGCGASRVAKRLGGWTLELTDVTEADSRLIWEWANEPGTRAVSFDSKAIPWEDHVAWFKSRLEDSKGRFWIARGINGDPVGQVRFAIENSEATISIGLDAKQRGKGYGEAIIRSACDRLMSECPITIVHAFIKPDNFASVRAFQNAGFAPEAPTSVKGHPALHYVLGHRA